MSRCCHATAVSFVIAGRRDASLGFWSLFRASYIAFHRPLNAPWLRLCVLSYALSCLFVRVSFGGRPTNTTHLQEVHTGPGFTPPFRPRTLPIRFLRAHTCPCGLGCGSRACTHCLRWCWLVLGAQRMSRLEAGRSIVRTYAEEQRFLKQISPFKYTIDKSFVPNMNVRAVRTASDLPGCSRCDSARLRPRRSLAPST